jgi:hypothetical protein
MEQLLFTGVIIGAIATIVFIIDDWDIKEARWPC